MRRQNKLLSQSLHPSLVGFLSFVSLTLVLALFATLAHCAEVTLAWNPNTEPDLAGYRVYYKTGYSGQPYDGTGAMEGDSPIDVGNVTEFTLRGLIEGITYFFAITAYDTEGDESDYSSEVSTSELVESDTEQRGGGCFIAAAGSNIDASPGAVWLVCLALALLFGFVLLLLSVVTYDMQVFHEKVFRGVRSIS